jgi:hypothetical protein
MFRVHRESIPPLRGGIHIIRELIKVGGVPRVLSRSRLEGDFNSNWFK